MPFITSGPQLSGWDFVDPSKPWVLVQGRATKFDQIFPVPERFRSGPWQLVPSIVIAVTVYLCVLRVVYIFLNPPDELGWIASFQNNDEHYEAFTRDWSITLAISIWMTIISLNILLFSPLGVGAWATFTVWSWTMVNIRHGLLVISPWVPAVRVPAEILLFPGLMTATATTVVWNFVLFPGIVIFLLKDQGKRKRFIAFFTNFRLTQLHVFNIFFAAAGAYLEPMRRLHLGDLAAATMITMMYLFFYYCVLDRVGVHLYPILSPRTPMVIPSMLLVIAFLEGGFRLWKQQIIP